MSSRLVNVRLDEDRLRKARIVREHGLALSDVIRETIDERFGQLNSSITANDIRNVISNAFLNSTPILSASRREPITYMTGKLRAVVTKKLRSRVR